MHFCLLLESWLEIWKILKIISDLISKFDGFFLNKSLNLWEKNQKIHNSAKYGTNKNRCQEWSLTPLVRTHFSTKVS
jgi:hypothetical protein